MHQARNDVLAAAIRFVRAALAARLQPSA
jgi:hypothetical protein